MASLNASISRAPVGSVRALSQSSRQNARGFFPEVLTCSAMAAVMAALGFRANFAPS